MRFGSASFAKLHQWAVGHIQSWRAGGRTSCTSGRAFCLVAHGPAFGHAHTGHARRGLIQSGNEVIGSGPVQGLVSTPPAGLVYSPTAEQSSSTPDRPRLRDRCTDRSAGSGRPQSARHTQGDAQTAQDHGHPPAAPSRHGHSQSQTRLRAILTIPSAGRVTDDGWAAANSDWAGRSCGLRRSPC
jgi:hypothetical protein